jgi:hypothetical protein
MGHQKVALFLALSGKRCWERPVPLKWFDNALHHILEFGQLPSSHNGWLTPTSFRMASQIPSRALVASVRVAVNSQLAPFPSAFKNLKLLPLVVFGTKWVWLIKCVYR